MLEFIGFSKFSIFFYVEQFKSFIFGGGIFGGFLPPGKRPNLVKIIVSNKSFYIVSFNFLCWAVQKFYFGGLLPLEDPKFGLILWVSNFYVEQFKSFILGGPFWGCLPLQRTPKFGPNNCLTNIFLHCEFQISMLSSSKVSFWEDYFGGLSPQKTPKFGPNNCLTNIFLQCEFQFLCWAVQKLHFGGFAPS